MSKIIIALTVTFLVLPAAVSLSEDHREQDSAPPRTWLEALAMEVEEGDPPVEAEHPAPDAGKGPGDDAKCVPLPFHCIEGYSGGAITPMAYMCNYCGCGCTGAEHQAGPTASYSLMGIGSKRLHTLAVTQAIGNRVELGGAVNQLWLGSLYDDIKKKAGADPVRRDVILYHLNLRGKLLPENSFNMPLPAVSAGVHVKYNSGLVQINRRLGKAFDTIGFDKQYGVDYTLTASKTLPTLAFGRPVIVSGGVRLSKAAQVGLLGFGQTYRGSFEGSAACLPTDWLVLGYEFRGKRNPYDKIPGLIGDEDNWHALSASVIVNKHLTISGLAGLCGNIGNANADTTWGLQVKWEF